jgi:ferredoxin-NADP reductase
MVCGPGAMTTGVTDALHALGVPYRNIRYERFDYGADATSGKDRRVMARFWAMALAVFAAGGAFVFR